MSLFRASQIKELKQFYIDQLPDLPEDKIEELTRAWYEKFGPSDNLPSPFQKHIFEDQGAYLKYYRMEAIERGKEVIYHFEFYLLDQPDKIGSFSISDLKAPDILKSRSKFIAFVKEQIIKASE
ncbi:hypothetical protein [Dyadobacter alkalitolerans]|jgi:hypothetical protein|uniref:hypothetical protein n=1 Tax=Dyadobacter alkalitolerans TaxID=492736 RepID=UPI000479345C|nr:hypothetical protein [Dyadobacter alkalitolerans]